MTGGCMGACPSGCGLSVFACGNTCIGGVVAGRTRKREKRITKESHRKGTKKAHHGWAARQAGKKD